MAMQSERRGGPHRHVALVSERADAALLVAAPVPSPGHFSLLRLSVSARLAIVAVASALLWGAVLWALR
jgi:hypothetical protein